jgi:UDP-N-acetylmuramoyl-tripeptide--D-alanyl-D-alanine ligase
MNTIEFIYKHWLESGRKHFTDTRNNIPGGIFFALKGSQFNGNQFAAEALDKGASLAVIDDRQFLLNEKTLLVPDVLTCLQQLARYHRNTLTRTTFIALSGSNGKTTTKELIRKVLAQQFSVAATEGNLNNHIGVPLTLLQVSEHHQFAVIEMGANHQGEIGHLCEIAMPDYGLVTNVGKAHLEGFGGFQGVIQGEGEMYDFLKKHHRPVFINADNHYLTERCGPYNNLIRYGTQHGVYCRGSYQLNQDKVNIRWEVNGTICQAQSHLSGAYNFENLLCAVCIGSYFGVAADKIKQGIESYVPQLNRSQLVVKDAFSLLLDHYNANPTSMEEALKNLRDNFSGKKMAVLGEMLELGEETTREHAHVISLLKNTGIDVVLIGKNFEGMEKEINGKYFSNSAGAAQYLKEKDLTGYTILLKGSRGCRLEVVADALL